jgi:hypothetical protein
MVNSKLVKRSSERYKKFLENQERPILIKDNYQFNIRLILHRSSIFLGYNKHAVKIFKQTYEVLKKTEYYNIVPPELTEYTGNSQGEYEGMSLYNIITHLKENGKDKQFYTKYSKY